MFFWFSFGRKMGIKLFYLNFWVLKKITFWNTINGRRIQKGASYGMGFSKSFFFVGANPKKKCASYGMGFSFFLWVSTKKTRCQLWHVHFKTLFFLGGVPTQKIGASYGIEISKPYYYLVVFPRIGASYGMESALFLFEGLPKKRLPFLAWNLPQKMCQLWHAFAPYLFSFGGFPKKNVCQLWHGNLFPYIYLGVDPFTYLCLVFYSQQPQPKTHLPTHPFFPKNHSCSCSSSWSKKWSLCRPGLPSTAAKAPWP